MSRPLRISVAGGVYHVVARGNAKQLIYLDDADRRSFLEIVRSALNGFQWSCLAYCLMPNHHHLVVRTREPTLSAGMRQINGIYAQRFNRRHGRCGHLFQGRFGATLVQSDSHLLEAIRYVALNPLRAELVPRPEDWPWSSHREVLGLVPADLVSVSDVLAHFGGPATDAVRRYRDYVARDADKRAPREQALIDGEPDFIRQHLPSARPSREIARHPWVENRRDLAEVLRVDQSDAAIVRAHRKHGFEMKEIAEYLGCHYVTVSRRIRRFEEAQKSGEVSDVQT